MVSLTNHNQLASIAWTCSKTSVEQRVNLNSYSENGAACLQAKSVNKAGPCQDIESDTAYQGYCSRG